MTVPSPEEIIRMHTERLSWRESIPAVREALTLVGVPGSRFLIPTPAAVVDLDKALANARAMNERVHVTGVSLRPHAKSHKSGALAHLQMHYGGARGVCAAKVGEAEALSGAGVSPILLTSPPPLHAAERVQRWLSSSSEALLTIDSTEQLDAIEGVGASIDTPIGVLIDLDPGLGRTGVTDATSAVSVAERIRTSRVFRLVGIQAYGGHWQHVAGATKRAGLVRDGMRRVASIITELEHAGFEIEIRTGGGTGTIEADLEIGLLNELQPGSYLLMDAEYSEALGADPDGNFATSLSIQSTVISSNQTGFVTIDAGLKAIATDVSQPTPMGWATGLRYSFFGDEHGRLERPHPGSSKPLLRLGDRVELMASHCDPTIDRYDVLHVVQGDVLVGVIPVDARGRGQ